jgi:hypothetical protein
MIVGNQDSYFRVHHLSEALLCIDRQPHEGKTCRQCEPLTGTHTKMLVRRPGALWISNQPFSFFTLARMFGFQRLLCPIVNPVRGSSN